MIRKACISILVLLFTVSLVPIINNALSAAAKPDFNDPDKDGCPHLNIKWKDPNDESKWIVINGNRDYDGIPDLNIDSDGDGIPDLNIDTDNDGKPDENIQEITEWKPEKTVDGDFPYDTMNINAQEEPEQPDNPTPPTKEPDEKPNTSVKGYYNPKTSMGGANTGDETELMLYLSLTMLSIGFISYAIYSYQKNTF